MRNDWREKIMRDRLERFIEPQEQDYEQALKEIRNGRKVSHKRTWKKLYVGLLWNPRLG